ncbi:MAG: sterol desaturase family protein [Pseudoxanthomonas sp.]
MPSPIELLLHPVSLTLFALFAVLMLWELLAPARRLPAVPGWYWRAPLVFASYFLLSSYLPLWWTRYLLPLQLFDLAHLGAWTGGLVGLLVYQACAYGWHRAIHAHDWAWRGFHQMHHSAERLDTLSAFWFSPLETAGWTAVASIALTLVVGLSPQATTVALLSASLLAMFTHTNVRTPRWLGYLVERPESHSWHHARGRHRDNYSELPIFDMLFGTFRNPRDFAPETGFHEGASLRVLEMSLARDVSEPRASTATAGTR